MDSLFFLASKIIWAVISPDSLLVILGVGAWLSLLLGLKQVSRNLLALLALLLLLIGSAPVGEWLIAPLEPRFRANQVWHWLYRSLAGDYEAMGNLPAALRERLAAETDLKLLTPLAQQESASGQTRKLLFRLRDGNTIESVLMQYHDRRTACISTQAGGGSVPRTLHP